VAHRKFDVEVEDTAHVSLAFESGAIGTVEVAWTATGWEEGWWLYGTAGAPRVQQPHRRARAAPRAPDLPGHHLGRHRRHRAPLRGPLAHARHVRAFVEAVRGEREVACTGEDGREAVRLILASYESASAGSRCARAAFDPLCRRPPARFLRPASRRGAAAGFSRCGSRAPTSRGGARASAAAAPRGRVRVGRQREAGRAGAAHRHGPRSERPQAASAAATAGTRAATGPRGRCGAGPPPRTAARLVGRGTSTASAAHHPKAAPVATSTPGRRARRRTAAASRREPLAAAPDARPPRRRGRRGRRSRARASAGRSTPAGHSAAAARSVAAASAEPPARPAPQGIRLTRSASSGGTATPGAAAAR
jgi:hypothetical protein